MYVYSDPESDLQLKAANYVRCYNFCNVTPSLLSPTEKLISEMSLKLDAVYGGH